MQTSGDATTAVLMGQNRILQRLVEGIGLDEALNDINEFVERLLPDSICSVMLADKESRYLHLGAGRRLPVAFQELTRKFPIGEGAGVCGTAGSRRETVIVDDMLTDPLTTPIRPILRDTGLVSCWSIPVFGGRQEGRESSKLLGTMAVYYRDSRTPAPQEQEVIAVATHLVSLAVERHRDQVALTTSESRHRTLVEHARVVIWESVPDSFDYSYVSPFAEELLDLPIHDWLKPGFWSRHVHPDDLIRVRETALREGRAGRSYRIEYRLIGRNTRVVWVDDTVTVVVQGNDVVAHRGVMVDVTDRKESELAVQQTEQRLKILSELTRSAAYALQMRPDGRITVAWSTPHVGVVSGYTPEELNQLGWEKVVHPEDRRLAREMLNRAAQGDIARSPIRYIAKDGSVRDVLHYLTPYQRDAFGTVLLGAVVDVTEWKAAERALSESEARFREIADAVSDIFWMVSVPDIRILYLNKACERAWGRTAAELRENPATFLNHVHPDDRADVEAAFRRFCASPETLVYDIQYRVVRPDGEVRRIADRGTPVANPQGVIDRVIGVARDVTEQWHLEQQLLHAQKMETVGRMAGGIAHDFNNWLTVIIGTCESLRKGLAVNDSRRQAVDQIEAAGQHAAALTHQLLAVSCRQMLSPRPLDLNDTIRHLQPMLQRLLGEDLAVSTRLDPEVDLIHADVSQIEQVIINLAVNARDAMPVRGELRFETSNEEVTEGPPGLEASLTLRPGRYVRLTVSDTGCGMTDEVQRHLFEPFFTTKPPGKGTGLGLATVLGIVRQSGGEISVESARSAGTTFRLMFPSIRTKSTPASLPETTTPAGSVEQPLAAATPDSDDHPTTVLLVEDEAAVRRIVSDVLSRGGYRVLEAPDGRAAEVLADRFPEDIQLVVTDVVMPGLCGRQLADSLRKRIPGVPILFTSGHSDEALVNHGIEQGTEAFLQKPFTPHLLLTKVQHLLPG